LGVIASKDNAGSITLHSHMSLFSYRRSKTIPATDVHTSRHFFATYLLEAHYDIRTSQELLSQNDVSTTMIYSNVLNKPGISVKSLLDE
jgi:site-specific recombinase XerD